MSVFQESGHEGPEGAWSIHILRLCSIQQKSTEGGPLQYVVFYFVSRTTKLQTELETKEYI